MSHGNQQTRTTREFSAGLPEGSLDDYRPVRMNEAVNLRKQILKLQDELFDKLLLAKLALWFNEHDRQVLQHALLTEEHVNAWATRMHVEKSGGTGGFIFLRNPSYTSLPKLRPSCEGPSQASRALCSRHPCRRTTPTPCAHCPPSPA